MTRPLRGALVATFGLLLTTTTLSAQTTGRITGQIVDNAGAAMPGVSLSVKSAALQGTQSATTTASGEFRLLALPPGVYVVTAQLPGFKTIEDKNVVVGIDKTVNMSLKMEVAPVSETIQVTGEAPAIDTSSATTGVNATADTFDRLPLQRGFNAIAQLATGTQQDTSGVVFYGSSGAENSYIIEGMNTTGVRYGTLEKELNTDLIEEVEVKTSGLPAEYGRMTGGTLNVLTKSGSNDFHGSVFGFFEGRSLESDNTTGPGRPSYQTTVANIHQKGDIGFSLGGPIVKDKLWFFGAYNYVDQTNNTTVIQPLTAPGSPSVGTQIPDTTKTNNYSGKLTYKLDQNNTLTATVFGDPAKIDGFLSRPFLIAGPPSTWQGTQNVGGADYVGRYDGVFGGSLMVRAQYGHHHETSNLSGDGVNTAETLDSRVSPVQASGGFGFFSDEDYVRNQARLDVSKFAGKHEFKVGGDWEAVNDDVDNFQGGAGQRIYILPGNAGSGGQDYYRHRFYVNDLATGYDRNDPSTWQIALPQISQPKTRNLSAYAQDSWKVLKGMTLNLGVRWEQQNVIDRTGSSAFKISDDWAPRLGLVWDIQNDGKTKFYANYAKYYENIPQDINIRSFGGEVVCFCYNFSPSASNIIPDPNARKSSLLGGPEATDPNLKGQFINEYIGGFEFAVQKNLVLGVKGTYRNLGRVIEDFLVPSSGEYFIANPGEGTLGQSLGFYAGGTAPAPKAERKNVSVEFTARKRFSNNWQFLASYLWSKLDGNYDGTFQNSTGQLDPNINSAFDYADFLVNAQGRLSSERQHQIKFDGSYEFKNGFNIGLSTHWYSGQPLTAYGYSLAYQNWEYYLTPRGSLGRGPSDYEASVHLNYPIKLGNKKKLDLIADVFNVFNRQSAITLDQRYNLTKDGPCAGIPDGLCNGDGGLATVPGTLTPLGQLSDAAATATNPDFLKKGIFFTLPRSIRFGLRFNF
jgi:Carboxypeptidase regulatory-like domain/TonB dependent receptor